MNHETDFVASALNASQSAAPRLQVMGDAARFLPSLCPLCGGAETSLVFSGSDRIFERMTRFNVLSCRACACMFTDGTSFGTVGAYYECAYPAEYYDVASGGRDGDPGSNPEMREILLAHLAATSDTRVLDVGCGNGGFLNHLRKAGYDVRGVEVSAKASENARREYGLEVFTGPVEEYGTEPLFAAATMTGVVEHLLNPVRTMSAIRGLLATGGICVFDFPDVESFESRLLGERWWGLDLPRHAVHYTRSSAARLLRVAGFELVTMVGIRRTWYHTSLLSPPTRTGVSRWSLRGILAQAVGAGLLAARQCPLVVMVCRAT